MTASLPQDAPVRPAHVRADWQARPNVTNRRRSGSAARSCADNVVVGLDRVVPA
ncbi:hypothetical protein [Blastococcus brunescens]|uniref:Uncharacterized protein n=1 Tax=Blastococcus brunescens TaxID=1564165 RepID=A0ABZ1B4M5_9ACTN|nr:hypothetical protein [Blastococcus sp. BMG 8361]WRL65760.1 hypothetical protein U6N30_09365 [Blastococcus sp. BMG 8361]